jgi:hypothetical protein
MSSLKIHELPLVEALDRESQCAARGGIAEPMTIREGGCMPGPMPEMPSFPSVPPMPPMPSVPSVPSPYWPWSPLPQGPAGPCGPAEDDRMHVM